MTRMDEVLEREWGWWEDHCEVRRILARLGVRVSPQMLLGVARAERAGLLPCPVKGIENVAATTNASHSLRQMERDGLVARDESRTHDHRMRVVALTAHGREVLALLEQHLEQGVWCRGGLLRRTA